MRVFYALGRSELVGCGVRLGDQMPAASLQDESARAMPMPNNREKPRTKLFLGRCISECHNDCPALGICARMWSAT